MLCYKFIRIFKLLIRLQILHFIYKRVEMNIIYGHLQLSEPDNGWGTQICRILRSAMRKRGERNSAMATSCP